MRQMLEETKRFWTYDEKEKNDSRYKDAGKFLVMVFNKVYTYFETLVRDNHAKDSAKFICDHSNSLLGYLEPTLLSFVATVSESHGYDVLEVYGLKSKAKDDTISLKYLMILIRLADLLDVANDRVNYYLLRQNLKNLSPASKFHWISHLVTDKIELNTDYVTDENSKMGGEADNRDYQSGTVAERQAVDCSKAAPEMSKMPAGERSWRGGLFRYSNSGRW